MPTLAARRKPASPRERRRERELAARRDDVIGAASEVFAEKGYEAAQMGEIAARAELSTATLYALFSGKDELYAEVVGGAAGLIRDRVRAEVDALASARERLLAVIDSLYRCWDENQALLRIYARGTQGVPWRIREAMGESVVRIRDEFTRWVETLARAAQREGQLAGLDARVFALVLLGSAITAATDALEQPGGRPLREVAAGVRACFERLLDAGPRP